MTDKGALATSSGGLDKFGAIWDLLERVSELEVENAELASFGYTVAHDLNQPLTVITGYCHKLMEGHTSGFSDDCMKVIVELHNSAVSMSILVDSLLRRAEEAVTVSCSVMPTDAQMDDLQDKPAQ